MSSHIRSNVRDATVTTAATGLSFAAILVAGIVLSRVLGPTGKGQLAQLAIWASFSVSIFLFGIPGATTFSVARWPESRAHLIDAAGRRLGIQALGGSLLFVLVVVATGTGPKLPLLAIIAYCVWIPANMGVELSMGYLQGRADFVRFNAVRLLASSLPVMVLISLGVVGGLTVATAALAYAVVVGGAGLVGLMWTRRDAHSGGDATGSERPDLIAVLRMSRSFARRDYVSTLAATANRGVDLFVLSLLAVSAADIGIYSVAVSSSGAVAMVGVSVGIVAFSRSAQGGQQRVLKYLLAWGLILTAIGAAVLYVVAPTLIPLVFGNDFQDSVPLVRILAFGGVGVSVSHILAGILRGIGRPGSVAIAEAVGAIATVVGILLLGTSNIAYVAYSAVAGFGLTLITEIAVVFAAGALVEPSGP